jgi:hypothetical protein
MAGPPLPSALHTWQQQHIAPHGDGDTAEGQWLVALKGTEPGHRFVIAEAAGRGLIAVVDFDSTAHAVGSRYYAWGAVTYLEPPISFDRLRASAVFAESRGRDWRWIRGRPTRLSPEEGERIASLAEGLPPVRKPSRAPSRRDGVEIWPMTGGLPPEKALQDAVATTRRLWRHVGFPSAPEVERRISPRDRPDLIADGVVGEVKSRIGHAWGPAQLERYLYTLDRARPEHAPWRGVLLHGEPSLAPAALSRLADSPDCDRIRAYGIVASRAPLRRWRRPVLQFPLRDDRTGDAG